MARSGARTISCEPFEIEAYARGARLVAGIDEAGRGCLAGPVAVGLAVFPPAFFSAALPGELTGLTDSKLLSPAQRDRYFECLGRFTLFQTAVQVSNKFIDRDGIVPAIKRAMLLALGRALRAGVRPDHVLVDGNYKLPEIAAEYPGTGTASIVKGDSRVFSIAAASILAKVRRDRRMPAYDRYWPGYDLARHKGYGTESHRAALRERGPAPFHRKSYSW